jgi:hypothetical protein
MEKDAFYFPHFCNARHDRKIMRVRQELGVEGYGIFFMVLEVLRDQKDFKYPLEDIDLLAQEFGTSEQKVRVVICNYKLFEIDEEEKFFSPKLLLYLQPYFRMKEQRKLAGMKSGQARQQKLLNDRSTTVQQSLNDSYTTVEQRKEKERKEKERKEKEILYMSRDVTEQNKKENKKEKEKEIQDFFDRVWLLYPKKRGKGQVSQKTLEKLYNEIGEEQFIRCIERYKKEIQDKETSEQYIKNGSTFFTSGYLDYTDENYQAVTVINSRFANMRI